MIPTYLSRPAGVNTVAIDDPGGKEFDVKVSTTVDGKTTTKEYQGGTPA